MSIKRNQCVEQNATIHFLIAASSDNVIVGKPSAPSSSSATAQNSALPAGMIRKKHFSKI
jgi:hypothetical protein